MAKSTNSDTYVRYVAHEKQFCSTPNVVFSFLLFPISTRRFLSFLLIFNQACCLLCSLLSLLPSLLPPASLQCSCTHTFRIKTDETSRSLDQADDEMQRYLCIVDCRWMTSYLSMSDVCDDVTRAMWGHDVDLTWQVLPTISSAVFFCSFSVKNCYSVCIEYFINRQLRCMISLLHRLNEDAQFPFYSVLFFQESSCFTTLSSPFWMRLKFDWNPVGSNDDYGYCLSLGSGDVTLETDPRWMGCEYRRILNVKEHSIWMVLNGFEEQCE